MRLHEDCVHISFRKEDFRVSFLAPFLVVFVSALIVCEVFFILTGNNSSQVLFLLVPGIVLVLCSAAILIIQGRYKFDLGPDGISCYNLGFHRRLASCPHRRTQLFASLSPGHFRNDLDPLVCETRFNTPKNAGDLHTSLTRSSSKAQSNLALKNLLRCRFISVLEWWIL